MQSINENGGWGSIRSNIIEFGVLIMAINVRISYDVRPTKGIKFIIPVINVSFAFLNRLMRLRLRAARLFSVN